VTKAYFLLLPLLQFSSPQHLDVARACDLSFSLVAGCQLTLIKSRINPHAKLAILLGLLVPAAHSRLIQEACMQDAAQSDP